MDRLYKEDVAVVEEKRRIGSILYGTRNSMHSTTLPSTSNNKAIARAITKSKGHSSSHMHNNHAASSLLPSATANLNCPEIHGLKLFVTLGIQRVTCNRCGRRLQEGDCVWSCIRCNFDACKGYYRSCNTVCGRPVKLAPAHGALSFSCNRTSVRLACPPAPSAAALPCCSAICSP